MKLNFKKHILPAAMLLAATVPAQASTVTFDYTASFGQTSPDGPSPWATAVIDDGNTAGSATLTFTVAGTVGLADVTEMYFNLDPLLDPTALSIVQGLGTVPSAVSIETGVDAFQADGDGKYDIFINMPTGGDRLEAGEVVTFDITGIASLTANDFNFWAAPGGGNGPFLSATKWQDTGFDQQDSDWVGAVPVPAAVWLFGSGLLGLVGIARRKKA